MPKSGQILVTRALVVAERLGLDRGEALTAGLEAYAKGNALGLFHPKPAELKEQRKKLSRVSILNRAVPVIARTPCTKRFGRRSPPA